MRTGFRKIVLLATVTGLLAGGGCSRETGEQPPDKPLAASLNLSTNTIRVGDAVTATLTVYHPTNGAVNLPGLDRDRELKIRSFEEETQSVSSFHARSVYTYQLTSFATGNHLIATGAITCATTDGQTLTTPFPPTLLTVKSLVQDPNVSQADIKDPLAWPGPFPYWIPGIALIILLAVITGIVATWLLRKPARPAKPPPVIPAHELAVKALRDLESKGYIESGQVEPFYVELSKIVRDYIERRFHLRAPEQTTEEFIRFTAQSDVLSKAHRTLVVEFLEQSDLVKFARFEPGAEDMRAGYASAERLVRETIPGEGTL
jgi:hypothetical protein